jgi:hypothetical protein
VSEEDVNRDRVTISDAATLLGVHHNTVRKRVKAGVYDAEKVVTRSGPTWLITRESLANDPTNTPSTRGSQSLTGRVQSEDLERVLTDLVRVTEESREAAVEKEKKDRLVQTSMEYWKVQYDIHKHLIIIGVASIAGVTALLGGVFGGGSPTYFGMPADEGAAAWVRRVEIVVIFLGFLVSVLEASVALLTAASNIRRIKDVETDEDLAQLEQMPGYRRHRLMARFAYGIALGTLAVFVVASTS